MNNCINGARRETFGNFVFSLLLISMHTSNHSKQEVLLFPLHLSHSFSIQVIFHLTSPSSVCQLYGYLHFTMFLFFPSLSNEILCARARGDALKITWSLLLIKHLLACKSHRASSSDVGEMFHAGISMFLSDSAHSLCLSCNHVERLTINIGSMSLSRCFVE